MATKPKKLPESLTLTTPLSILKYLMDENDMKQVELAKLLEVNQPTVSRIMRGRINLTVEHIRKIRRHFKVSADLFIK